jgi:hypothetical protein
MSTQEQFLRQDVVAQQNLSVEGSTFLGNDPSDTVTVVGKMIVGGTTVEPVASAFFGPGPLTNEVIFSFDASLYGAAVCTVTVVDDSNADVYAATFTAAHNGVTAVLSSASGVADVWGGTDPTFNANYNAGTVELRMSLADAVSVTVAVDAKLFAAQVSPFISLSVQPSSVTVVEGDVPATFTVVASTNDGGTLSYQWEEDDGGGFASLSDDSTYSGALTDTLTITTTDTSLDTFQYRCVVSSDGGSAPFTSIAATLTVNVVDVTILANPTNTTVVEGDDPAVFTVVASTNESLSSLTFQWEENDGGGFTALSNDTTYSGVNTDTLIITTIDTSLDTYQYRCVISTDSAIGSAFTWGSNTAVLTVDAATVTISADPSNLTVDSGDPAQFTVVASTNETLSALTFSWEEDAGTGFVALTDGGVYSGTDTDTLDISDSTGLNTYEYRCVVSTDSAIAPSATSAAAVLTVNP